MTNLTIMIGTGSMANERSRLHAGGLEWLGSLSGVVAENDTVACKRPIVQSHF